MGQRVDAVVIGGGIAGVAVASELAEDRSVLLLESELMLSQHTTGRSAAVFLRPLGNPVVRALSRASRELFVDPPDGFGGALVVPRSAIWVSGPDQTEHLRAFAATVAPDVDGLIELDADAVLARAPFMRRGWPSLGLMDEAAMDIDVGALHEGYVRMLRRRGGSVRVDAQVVAMRQQHGVWSVELANSDVVHAPLVVNAAGAWADDVAAMAGARGVGLRPLRRTVFTVRTPERLGETNERPSVRDVNGTFYVKPEGPQFLCSPADETPSVPCDARADEIDIARAIDIINEATLLEIRSVRASWAGLRSFVDDRSPVVGLDADLPGLLWVAALGGFGIQAAPAIAQAAASLVRSASLPESIATHGVTADHLCPGRCQRPSV